jgi:DNA polymerase-3 subunit epsilon
MESVVVIDFETTGISPADGARATEVAVVLVREGQVVDRYQSLMNAGVWIPPFIESYTGITNAMVRRAPPVAEVMAAVAEFIGDLPLVAHNASFDQKFLETELGRIHRECGGPFACTMLSGRCIFPDAPNHKLGTLVEYTGVPVQGVFHRALADAEMTAHLLLRLEQELEQRFGVPAVTHAQLRMIQKAPRWGLAEWLQRKGWGR